MRLDKYICYIGRPSYQKNPIFLVEVVKEVHALHPEVGFCLLGVGYYSPELDRMKVKIAEYGLDKVIELSPWLSHKETLECVKNSMFYLTVARYEGLPLAVIEAMSSRIHAGSCKLRNIVFSGLFTILAGVTVVCISSVGRVVS